VSTSLVPISVFSQNSSTIIGSCNQDEEANKTTCVYKVLSGKPALSFFIFPVPENCQDNIAIKSERLTFESPALHSDHICGEIYGIKSEQEMVEGQIEEFMVVYDGIYEIETAMIYTSPRGSSSCTLFPVPAVTKCPFVPSVDWSIDATVNEFLFRKPVTTSAKLATMKISSNIPVSISFNSFDDLKALENENPETISTGYAITPIEQTVPPSKFFNARDFNNQGLTLEGNRQEHGFSIWSKLNVETKTRADDYHNTATVTLTVENTDVYNDGL
jgi:hypothetical protein